MKNIKEKNSIVGLKELRNNIKIYINRINKGESFTVIRRSDPVFRISPVDDDSLWENIIDFTKIKRGGISINSLLSRL